MSTGKSRIHLMPHKKTLSVEPGRKLIASLAASGIFLRSDCGGKGVCGKCSVNLISPSGSQAPVEACAVTVSDEMTIQIPESSMLSSHIMEKAPVSFPGSFINGAVNQAPHKAGHPSSSLGIAVDLGTTTIAVYLCRMEERKVISSLSVKNPQALYGDDVISRIDAVNRDRDILFSLRKLTVRAIEWGIRSLLKKEIGTFDAPAGMVVVGNPAMVHILAGVSPRSIGVFPYEPAFRDGRSFFSKELGFSFSDTPVHTLPNVSGFLGGDILGAAMAVELSESPEGTLLVDLGTNGELMLKARGGLFATSCATGPAFEGAALSCGMQAVPGAVERVRIDPATGVAGCDVIGKNGNNLPSGICGSGVVGTVAELRRSRFLEDNGRFERSGNNQALGTDENGLAGYTLVPGDRAGEGRAVILSQKDIRAVQLGKAALMTGIEFLCREAGITRPEKIIVAGAFGSHLDKGDMMTLGMIPEMDAAAVEMSGNSAGAGAVMALCDEGLRDNSREIAEGITVVELAGNTAFQSAFVERLNFPPVH